MIPCLKEEDARAEVEAYMGFFVLMPYALEAQTVIKTFCLLTGYSHMLENR